MIAEFDRPWMLLLLTLCVLPLFGLGSRWHSTPSLDAAPTDKLSAGIDVGLRILAALPVAFIILGLAGLHAPGKIVGHTGQGAHIAIVLDRSLSMDEGFAARGQKAQESKSQAAARLLQDFVGRRPNDSIAIVAFSTSPIPVMPLTTHRAALNAAVAAMRRHALANTDIGGGIAMGLAQFANDPRQATRVVLLVSDGAGDIAEQTRDYIRAEAARLHIHLYYLYLRAGDDPPLAEAADGNTDLDHPAGLAAFLKNLGVPYQGFEANDPQAARQAAAQIDALETRPLIYTETTKRTDFDKRAYALAACCILLSLLAQRAERVPA